MFSNVSHDLSGGEKGRLALAKLIYSQKNVLILDEPTNHLDIPSREALEDALGEYEGTIITVSHDRYFLDQISTQIFSFAEDGDNEVFSGNYSEFHEWKENRNANFKTQTVNSEAQFNGKDLNSGAAKQEKSNLSKNQQLKIEHRIKEIEKELPVLEKSLADFTIQMNLPEIISDHKKLNEVSVKYKKTETKIQNLYAEWEELLEG